MRFFTFIFCFVSACIFSQKILNRYPANQTPYIGGYQQYYKDLHDIATEKKLQPCTNPDEIYEFRVVIMDDGSVQYIRDLNQKTVDRNKCAYNLAREAAKYQTNWNPAVVKGIKQVAVASFLIYPAELFANYQEGYVPNYTPPVYLDKKTGVARDFPKDFVLKFNKNRFNWNDIFTIMAEFTVTKDGKIKDVVLTKPSGVEEFDKEIRNTINILSKTWKPATINGNPFEDRYRFTINGITDPE